MSSIRMFQLLLAAPLCAAALIALPAKSQDLSKGVCLFSADVDHVEALDDKHIRFFMKDGAVWDNELFRECYTLKPGSYIDWGHDYWHVAVCSWPMKRFPLPMMDSSYPPDTHPWTRVYLRPSQRLACRLGNFTPVPPR